MSILNYFEKKPGTSKTKKRNFSTAEIDESDNGALGEPQKKKRRLNEDEDKENENIDNNNNNNNNIDDKKDEKKEEPVSYEYCDKLLDQSWKEILKNEFEKPYYLQLRRNLKKAEKTEKQEIFPPVHEVFRAFNLCPWDNLKAVILGQDPYHDNGQAEGLCFSVKKGIKLPSSLKNIYKEAKSDIGFKDPGHGSLVEWGMQGVLLLNTVLTVRAHSANSHKKYGWQELTDAVIRAISDKHNGVVFILWGNQAKAKAKMIDKKKHRIVQSAHPSGLSASRGFYGSKCFSKTNDLLKELGKEPIDWQISPL